MKVLFKHSEIIDGNEFIKCFIGLPEKNIKQEWIKIKKIIDLQLDEIPNTENVSQEKTS